MMPILLGLGAADGLMRAASSAFATSGRGEAKGGAGPDFREVLSEVATSASQSIHAAEKVGAAAIQGKASAREVVESLMQAEQNLQIALAVRDKAVAALQEISRMPI